MKTQNSPSNDSLSTGGSGLDNILCGGLAAGRIHLIEGEPGTGKTTTGMQFLLADVRRGESVVYIMLAKTATELRGVTESHGWSLDGVHTHEVLPSENLLQPVARYTKFHPSEVKMGTSTQMILGAIEKCKPTCVVLDSLSGLQLLADRSAAGIDLQVRCIAHGVITPQQSVQEYSTQRRRASVVKCRGRAFRGGTRDYDIHRGGLRVYPQLVAAESRVSALRDQLESGLPELDALLGGCIEEGTNTLIAGPRGTGKSLLASQCVDAAAKRGESSVMFLLEEAANHMLIRTDGLGMGLRQHIERCMLTIQQIDPAEFLPREFAAAVCRAADDGAKVVMIDSINGYPNAMPNERILTTNLHELLTYLGQRGVVTILIGVQQDMLGGQMSTTVDASYLADNVLMLRYFEHDGEVKQAISAFKKRGPLHERIIRQFSMSRDGLRVGAVLRGFRGILTGVPVYLGTNNASCNEVGVR